MVLNNQDYINKAKDLLAQRDTHRPLTADPTNKHNKLINMLRTIKTEGGLETLLTKDYPTAAGPQNSMGYQKSTKRTTP